MRCSWPIALRALHRPRVFVRRHGGANADAASSGRCRSARPLRLSLHADSGTSGRLAGTQHRRRARRHGGRFGSDAGSLVHTGVPSIRRRRRSTLASAGKGPARLGPRLARDCEHRHPAAAANNSRAHAVHRGGTRPLFPAAGGGADRQRHSGCDAEGHRRRAAHAVHRTAAGRRRGDSAVP